MERWRPSSPPANSGSKVAAVERGRIGGDCLWTGCVPSKSLIASAGVAHTVREAHRFGVTTGETKIDLEAVWGRIKTVQAVIAATDDCTGSVP